MAEELTFYIKAGAGNSVACQLQTCNWIVNTGISNFSPAVLRLLGDLFLGADTKAQTIPNFIVYFGKFTETVTFNVQLNNDIAWHEFRKFATQTAYFETDFSTNPLQFYWGGTGDPFYTGENNVGNLVKYQGYFSTITATRKWPAVFWTLDIKFMIGKVIQL